MINKVKEAMAELRRTTSDLRPSTLDDLGIVPTMTWFFREFEMVCHGKTIEKNFIVNESEVPVPLKPTIFRILQEAMNNIVKHADADLIRVELKNAEGLLQLSIEDNGKGFDQAGVSVRRGANRGFGLLTMKERARSSNGTFEIHSTPGSGTRVQIAWRLKESAARQSDTDMSHTLDR
jgi:two-component system NarL family sensor kinase